MKSNDNTPNPILNRTCQHCADWDYDHSEILGMEPPKNYPKADNISSPSAPPHHAAGVRKIIPVIQTYDSLNKGCAYCFYNVFKGTWNIGMAETYLRIIGVKKEYSRSHIIDKAMMMYRTTPNHTHYQTELHYPALWTSRITLDQCIDTPMHHLFEGVIKTLIDHIAIWLK